MLARPVQVFFSTADGSATSTSPADFDSVSNFAVEFDATTLSRLVTVNLVDDTILENAEVFFGNLNTTDDAVDLAPAAATGNIMERSGDDGKRFVDWGFF